MRQALQIQFIACKLNVNTDVFAFHLSLSARYSESQCSYTANVSIPAMDMTVKMLVFWA